MKEKNSTETRLMEGTEREQDGNTKRETAVIIILKSFLGPRPRDHDSHKRTQSNIQRTAGLTYFS